MLRPTRHLVLKVTMRNFTLYDFLITTLKRAFQLGNINQATGPLPNQTIFVHDQAHETMSIMSAAPAPEHQAKKLPATVLPARDTALIGLLDMVLSEQLKLDQYYLLLGGRSAHSKKLLEFLELMSISASLRPSQDTLFIFGSRLLGEHETFCSGSYDNEQLTVQLNLPALEKLLAHTAHRLQLPQPAALFIIAPAGPAQFDLALLVSRQLHAAGLVAQIDFAAAPSTHAGARALIRIGTQEQQEGTVTILNLIKSSSITVPQVNLIQELGSRSS